MNSYFLEKFANDHAGLAICLDLFKVLLFVIELMPSKEFILYVDDLFKKYCIEPVLSKNLQGKDKQKCRRVITQLINELGAKIEF